MAYSKPQLSLWEKFTFFYAIFRTFANGFYTSLVAPFSGGSGSANFSNHVKLAMMRTYLKHTSVRHNQWLAPDLDEAYPAYAKKEGFEPKHVTLKDGTKAYWLGNPSAEKVIFWFHGGGYNLPPDPTHLTFAASLTNPQVAVLMLSYTLAPHGTYPHQLRQAVELLRYTITFLHRNPANITLGGDSAGANLAIGVLSHLLHPHPEIERLDLRQLVEGGKEPKLGAAILLAPWVSFSNDWPSTQKNRYKDLVSPVVGDLWWMSFLGGRPRDAYNEPLAAEEGWWNRLEGVVKEVLIVGGGDEILIDSIKELARRYEAVHANVTTAVVEGEWHDRPTVGILGGGGEQHEVIKSFVASKL